MESKGAWPARLSAGSVRDVIELASILAIASHMRPPKGDDFIHTDVLIVKPGGVVINSRIFRAIGLPACRRAEGAGGSVAIWNFWRDEGPWGKPSMKISVVVEVSRRRERSQKQVSHQKRARSPLKRTGPEGRNQLTTKLETKFYR
jgi:hypothetical protein